MAIAYKATAPYGGTTSSTTHNIPYPAGIVAGDFLVMQIANPIIENPANTPANWTRAVTTNPAGFARNSAVFYRRATGALSGTQAVTFPTATTAQGGMVAYTGVHPTTPMDVAAVGSANAAGTTHLAPQLTPVSDDTLIIHIFVAAGTPADWTTLPAGTTQRYEIESSVNGRRSMLTDKPGPAAGVASGTAQSNTASSGTSITQSLALRPEPTLEAGNNRMVLYSQMTHATSAPGQLRYDLRGLATDSQALSYHVFGRATTSPQVGYDVRGLAQKSAELTYGLKRLSGQSRQALYNALGLSSLSRQALYNLYGRATQSRALAYDTRTLAGERRTLNYDVLFSQLLASQLAALNYDVKGLVGNQAAPNEIRYALYTRTTPAPRTLMFDLRTLAGKSALERFDVRAYATHTNQLRYEIMGRATSLRALSFDASGLATDQGELRWDIYTRSGTTRLLAYSTRALAGAIEGPGGRLSYDVRALATADPATLLHHILMSGPVSGRALTYSINGRSTRAGIIGYDVLQTAGIVRGQRVVLFNLREFAKASGAALYNISSRTSQNRSVGFDIMVRAATARQIAYALRSLAGAPRTTLYDVLAHAILVSASLKLGYDISDLAGQNGAVQYDLNSLTGTPRTLFFNTRTYSNGHSDMRYDVHGLSQAGRVVRFDVTFPVGIQRTIHYDLGGYLVVSRSILFRVERLGAEFMVLVEGEVLPASAMLDDLWHVTLLEERMEAGQEILGIPMEAATLLGHKKLIVPTRLEEDISPAGSL